MSSRQLPSQRLAPRRSGILPAAWLLFVLWFLPHVGRGAETPVVTPADRGPTAAATADDEVAARRAALAGELADTRRQLEETTGDTQEAAKQAVALLETLDQTYAQQIAALKEAADQTSEQDKVQSELAAARAKGALTEAPPYSILQLDSAQDELENETRRGKTIDAAIQAAEDALQQANDLLSKRERARREAKEALETNRDPAAAPALQRTLRLRQLESRVGTEQVRLRELQLKNARLAPALHTLRLKLLAQKADRLAAGTRFSRDDLQDQLVQLDKQEVDLKQALDSAKLDLAPAERQWRKVKQQLDAGSEVDRAVVEEAEARRLAQQTRQLAVSILGQRIQWLAARKEVWNRRFLVASGTMDRAQLLDWTRETGQTLDELDREDRVQRARLDELKDARASRSNALAAPDLPPAVSRWIREQQRELDGQLHILDTLLTSLDDSRRLHGKLQRDLQTRLGSVSFAQRLRDVLETARAVWHYEISAIDDRPITVGKVLVGIFLFVFGVSLSRYLSRQLGRRVLPRLGLEAGAAAALQSLSFYALVSLLTLLALNIINVPLTAFTLLGGALAIGLGFGSQNIVNNFISGLILFAERPIRVGDMIEVDGTYGVVEHIGPRSTRVRSFSNIHIIVPNSSFLEKNVINWTLSDDRIRTQVTVGVAYGSPTREVARLIRKAVDEQAKVLKAPEPIVIFTDFGDSALIFDVYFWIRMRKQMDRRIVESDIRHHLDELFHEAGITIAFPQRDVHLDSVRPVEVRLVTDATEGEDAGRRRPP
jgi:potassium efflux system protein